MSEEKKVIPYAVQKGNRPKIEEVISACLDGEMKQSALDFAAYMRDNQMPFKLHTSTTRSQRADYGGEHICNIIVYGEDDWKHVDRHSQGDPACWTVAPNLIHMDQYEAVIKDEKLRLCFSGAVYWCKHGSHGGDKGVCDPNKPCAGGRDLTILGDGYDGMCKWLWPAIENPDEATIKVIKRLLELEKQARDNENHPERQK